MTDTPINDKNGKVIAIVRQIEVKGGILLQMLLIGKDGQEKLEWGRVIQ